MHPNELERWLIARTELIVTARRMRQKGLTIVPLELKGLKANMMKLQGRVDRLNTIASAADEKGAMLESHLGDIGKQLGAHVDDIEFAANVLGNSSNGSGEAQEPPAVQQPEQAKTESTAAASPPAVGQPATFPGQ